MMPVGRAWWLVVGALLGAAALLGSGCWGMGGQYEILRGTRAPAPDVPEAHLYWRDSGEAPPATCLDLGAAKAWSRGEKTFPYEPFRRAARELGGDAVLDIHPDPAPHPRNEPTHIGTIARCGPAP